VADNHCFDGLLTSLGKNIIIIPRLGREAQGKNTSASLVLPTHLQSLEEQSAPPRAAQVIENRHG
jgi:hypothetical protein